MSIILPSETVIYPFSYGGEKGLAHHYENGAHVEIATNKRVYIWPKAGDSLCWIYCSLDEYHQRPEKPNWVLGVNRETFRSTGEGVKTPCAPDFDYKIPKKISKNFTRMEYWFDGDYPGDEGTYIHINHAGKVFMWGKGSVKPFGIADCWVYPSAAYFNSNRGTPMFYGKVDSETLKREGFGTRHFLDANSYRKKYEGLYKDDAMHGYGTLDYTNGKRFYGTFNNNDRVSGTDQYSSGFIRCGPRAKNGKLEGKGRITMPDKTVIDGIFHQDRLNGEATITYRNGDTLNGLFINGNTPVDYTLTRSTDQFHYVFRSRTEYSTRPSMCVKDHDGNEIITYRGSVNSDHQPEVKGSCSFPSGDILSCSWKNGAIDADEECVFIWVCDNVTEQTFTGKLATLVAIEPRVKHDTLHAIFSGMMGVSMNVQTEDEDEHEVEDQDEHEVEDQDEESVDSQDEDEDDDFYEEEHRLDQTLAAIRQEGLVEAKQDLEEELKEVNAVLLERTRLVESMQPRWNDAIQAMLSAHQNVAMIREQLELMDQKTPSTDEATPMPRTFTCADDPRNVPENIKNSV